MAPASPDQTHQDTTLAQRLLAAGQPKFSIYEQQRRAGAPPPPPFDADEQPPGTLSIPGERPRVKLLSEREAANWLVSHVRETKDIIFARIPAYAVEGVTTCILPKVVVEHWPLVVYGPIDKAETSYLRVVDIRGRGKGCAAARAIPRGERVARERALLVMPRTCVSPLQIVSNATSAMMPNQRAAFFALYNCKEAESHDDALGIISTNSFLIPGVQGHNVLYSAVFETFSRLNHSCCPNAMFIWDHDTFSGEIRALRPISEGEEITVSYFQDMMEPATVEPERQKFLYECYNFKCACLICGRPSTARSRSDEDRPVIFMAVTNINKFHREMVQDWMKNGESGDHARLLNYLHTIKKALDQEMIFHPDYWIHLARAIVMTRCALREAKPARKWARRAAQHARAATGSDGGWDAIANEPEKCEWWGVWNRPRPRGIWDNARHTRSILRVA